MKRRNKSDGERTYPMMGRVPLMDEEVDHCVVIWVTLD
jgi:hypothetical protein